MVNFSTQVCSESISEGFSASETWEVLLDGNVWFFSRLQFYW